MKEMPSWHLDRSLILRISTTHPEERGQSSVAPQAQAPPGFPHPEWADRNKQSGSRHWVNVLARRRQIAARKLRNQSPSQSWIAVQSRPSPPKAKSPND